MTDQYAVIGNPIAQSKSPVIHTAFAQATGQAMAYTRLEAALDGFAAAAHAFRSAGGKGLNITAPFKLDAFALATHPSERAQRAGAVNAIKFEGDQIFAENFDGVGLVADIQNNLGIALHGQRVLILGAGGATRGVLEPLLALRPACVVIANRDVPKAQALAHPFQAEDVLSGCGYDEIGTTPFDVVLNATSASLTGQLPPVSSQVFGPACLAYELVYGKGLTPFLQLARGRGAQVADGVGMLVEQAAEAFLWWRGVRPATSAVIDAIRVPLE
jgi:shikimate dehydrogenase